eukprot:Pgem_evm1s11254
MIEVGVGVGGRGSFLCFCKQSLAVFNFENESRPFYCNECKSEGMINFFVPCNVENSDNEMVGGEPKKIKSDFENNTENKEHLD